MTQDNSNQNDKAEWERLITKRRSAWLERAKIAHMQSQADMEQIALQLASAYQQISPPTFDEPDVLIQANHLRKRIESSEQHRTMSVEHGLNNEAIDVTLEIQAMEQELIALIRTWKPQE